MKTLLKTSFSPAFLLVAALSLLTACGSSPQKAPLSWAAEAERLGIPEDEIAWIATEAIKNHGGVVISMSSPGKDKKVVSVSLGSKRTSRSGKVAIFKMTKDGWKEDESTAGQWAD